VPGTLTGSVLVILVPAGVKPAAIGAEECPSTGTPTLCANPALDIGAKIPRAHNEVAYTFSLNPGNYTVAGFYELVAGGPRFVGSLVGVTVKSKATTSQALVVDYTKPATLNGKVTITAVPTSDPVTKVAVLACPASFPYTGGTPSESCVTKLTTATSSGTSASASYSMTGMPKGSYLAYPGYCAESGCVTSTSGVAVRLRMGQTTTQNLKTTFLQGDEGLVFGKVTVTGAPVGFSDTVAAIACNVATSACTAAIQPAHGDYNLLLGPGSYTVKGAYLVTTPSPGIFYGNPVPVVITAGLEVHEHLAVAYQGG
jgi:hypothetical protein